MEGGRCSTDFGDFFGAEIFTQPNAFDELRLSTDLSLIISISREIILLTVFVRRRSNHTSYDLNDSQHLCKAIILNASSSS